MSLDEIVTKLNGRKQRATYGAVAGLLGVLPRGVMGGRQPDQKHSWVVAKSNGRPTNYKDEQIHPDCLRQIHEGLNNVIDDSATLRQCLRSGSGSNPYSDDRATHFANCDVVFGKNVSVLTAAWTHKQMNA